MKRHFADNSIPGNHLHNFPLSTISLNYSIARYLFWGTPIFYLNRVFFKSTFLKGEFAILHCTVTPFPMHLTQKESVFHLILKGLVLAHFHIKIFAFVTHYAMSTFFHVQKSRKLEQRNSGLIISRSSFWAFFIPGCKCTVKAQTFRVTRVSKDDRSLEELFGVKSAVTFRWAVFSALKNSKRKS